MDLVLSLTLFLPLIVGFLYLLTKSRRDAIDTSETRIRMGAAICTVLIWNAWCLILVGGIIGHWIAEQPAPLDSVIAVFVVILLLVPPVLAWRSYRLSTGRYLEQTVTAEEVPDHIRSLEVERLVNELATDVIGLSPPPRVLYSAESDLLPTVFGPSPNKASVVLTLPFLQLEKLTGYRKDTVSVIQKFVLAHELSHAKNKDLAFMPWARELAPAMIVWTIASLFLSLLLIPVSLSPVSAFLVEVSALLLISLPLLIVTTICFHALLHLVQEHRQRCADVRALTYLDSEEARALLDPGSEAQELLALLFRGSFLLRMMASGDEKLRDIRERMPKASRSRSHLNWIVKLGQWLEKAVWGFRDAVFGWLKRHPVSRQEELLKQTKALSLVRHPSFEAAVCVGILIAVIDYLSLFSELGLSFALGDVAKTHEFTAKLLPNVFMAAKVYLLVWVFAAPLYEATGLLTNYLGHIRDLLSRYVVSLAVCVGAALIMMAPAGILGVVAGSLSVGQIAKGVCSRAVIHYLPAVGLSIVLAVVRGKIVRLSGRRLFMATCVGLIAVLLAFAASACLLLPVMTEPDAFWKAFFLTILIFAVVPLVLGEKWNPLVRLFEVTPSLEDWSSITLRLGKSIHRINLTSMWPFLRGCTVTALTAVYLFLFLLAPGVILALVASPLIPAGAITHEHLAVGFLVIFGVIVVVSWKKAEKTPTKLNVEPHLAAEELLLFHEVIWRFAGHSSPAATDVARNSLAGAARLVTPPALSPMKINRNTVEHIYHYVALQDILTDAVKDEKPLRSFLLSCQHVDGGFGAWQGGKPCIESTFYALAALRKLGSVSGTLWDESARWGGQVVRTLEEQGRLQMLPTTDLHMLAQIVSDGGSGREPALMSIVGAARGHKSSVWKQGEIARQYVELLALAGELSNEADAWRSWVRKKIPDMRNLRIDQNVVEFHSFLKVAEAVGQLPIVASDVILGTRVHKWAQDVAQRCQASEAEA